MEPSKYTLLEIVQRVAEYTNAGTVNSINDTRESVQLANIVKECYMDLIERNEIESRYSLYKLQNVSDVKKPTYLKLPDRAWTIDVIKYKRPDTGKLTDLQYLEPLAFIEKSLYLDPTRDDVQQVTDFTDIVFNVRTDVDPFYYTILNDKYIVFDAYDKRQRDTLIDNDIICYGRYFPVFKLEDDFIPEISAQQFSILLSNAKIHADYELKEHTNPLETNRAQKLFNNASNNARSHTRGTRLWNNRMDLRRR